MTYSVLKCSIKGTLTQFVVLSGHVPYGWHCVVTVYGLVCTGIIFFVYIFTTISLMSVAEINIVCECDWTSIFLYVVTNKIVSALISVF